MEKMEIVIRFTIDHGKTYEQTVFKWFEKTHLERKVLHYPGLEIHLSRYEYGVLSLLARHPGRLFTKEQIFEAVWHKDSDSYLRAVSSTIGRIRQKIEDDKEHPRYIKTISNRGYQFMPKSEDMHSTRNP